MGCQVGVETAKLTTVMKDKETETTKSYCHVRLKRYTTIGVRYVEKR